MMGTLQSSGVRTVGPYRLVQRLGSGGMGEVYLGRDRHGRAAAVKVVQERLAADPGFRARFSREVALAARVSSPYTARILDADTEADQPWLAMEYVPGPTLAHQISASGPMPDHQVTALAVGLAAAIESLHRQSVVHRDLKPANVILSPTGPKVIDLGLAHGAEYTALTSASMLMGTPGWVAPEQLTGRSETPGTDIFAWACIVGYAATGEHPFGGGRAEAVHLRILSNSPDPRVLAKLEPHLRTLLTDCLAGEPGYRPAAAEVLSRLTYTPPTSPTLLEGAATVVTGMWNPSAYLTTAAPTQASGPRTTSTPARGRRWWIVPAALATAAGVTLGALANQVVHPSPATPAEAASSSPSTGTPSKRPTTGSNTGEQASGSATSEALWTGNPTRLGIGTPPQFPASLPGYADVADQWTATTRAFDSEWSPASAADPAQPFPTTMNGCGEQRFLVRWRSTNPDVPIRTGYTRAIIETEGTVLEYEESAATSGWMSLDGCATPLFRADPPTTSSATLADVVVQVRQLTPTID